MYKRFSLTALFSLAVLLVLFGGLNSWIDPMFHYHPLQNGFSFVDSNERYYNAGIARNYSYDSFIIGTSVTANFRASQFDKLFGASTVKLTFPDGYFSDFDRVMQIAFENRTIKRVFCGIDTNILSRPDSARTEKLPEYLYDRNPFNDVKYLFNKDVFFGQGVKMLTQRLENTSKPFDEISTWDERFIWSKKKALSSYRRPDPAAEPLSKDAYAEAAAENLAIITRWLTDHPDTEFYFFMAPYSILYWDEASRLGKIDAVFALQQQVLETLAQYPNARLYYFMSDTDLITDLNCYTDPIHYSAAVNRQLAERMAAGDGLSPEEIAPLLAHLKRFVTSYPYDTIFSS